MQKFATLSITSQNTVEHTITFCIGFQQHRAFGQSEHAASFSERILAGAWSLWSYLFKALVPLNLSVLYPKWAVHPASWLSYLPALGWAALLGLLWLGRKRLGRGWLFALVYFTVCLLPVLGF